MSTLVLSPRMTEDSRRLARAAEAAGWPVERLSSWRIPAALGEADCVLYAEPLFVLHAAPLLGLAMIEPSYDWLPTLPREYLRRDVSLSTLGAARSLAGERFVKPAAEKLFAAKIIADGSALPSAEAASDAVPVLISDVVRFTDEFRCFVIERRASTMSPYMKNGMLARDDAGGWPDDPAVAAAAGEFVRRLLADDAVDVPPAVVIDVGRLEDGTWAVVEANAAWGSGLYGCDAGAVLDVVRRSCVRADRLSDADRRWTIDHAAEDFSG